MPSPNLELFVACLPGLEPIVATECEAIGMDCSEPGRPGAGGVAGRGSAAVVCALNARLGAASHVLWRVASFGARHFSELEKKTLRLPWREWLGDDAPFTVAASARHSKLFHTGAIVERVASAIASAIGRAPAAGDAASTGVPVLARLADDQCVLSIDTSGRPLHEQGWRLETAKAPLREDLAHALVTASGWLPGTPFVDPFCGSGTLPIIAARRALGIAPGAGRSFAGEQLAQFPADEWRAARAPGAPVVSAPILGSDRDAGAIGIATRNAARAGVAEIVQLETAAMSAAPGLAPGIPIGAVVTNLPFGRRVGGGDLVPLYQSFGRRLQALPAGWRIGLLAADRRLALRTGLPLRTAFLTNHGGLQVRALVTGAR